VLAVFSARVTSEGVHDATQFKLLLEEWIGKGEPLLADRAYDAASNFEFAKEKGFRPIIHPRSFELHGFARRDMAVEFDLAKDLYRLRSVAEGLSLDDFSLAFALSLLMPSGTFKKLMVNAGKMAVAFSISIALLPLLGWLVGLAIYGWLASFSAWVVLIVFAGGLVQHQRVRDFLLQCLGGFNCLCRSRDMDN
jgi:hypothetical protein